LLSFAVAIVALALAALAALRWWALAMENAPDPKLIFGDLHASHIGWKIIFALLIFIAVAGVLRAASERGRVTLAAIIIALACFVEPAILFARWSLPYSFPASRFTYHAPTTDFLRQFPPEA
jgi:hypothetical protein